MRGGRVEGQLNGLTPGLSAPALPALCVFDLCVMVCPAAHSTDM